MTLSLKRLFHSYPRKKEFYTMAMAKQKRSYYLPEKLIKAFDTECGKVQETFTPCPMGRADPNYP